MVMIKIKMLILKSQCNQNKQRMAQVGATRIAQNTHRKDLILMFEKCILV